MAHPVVIYRRYTQDPKSWWHWDSNCNIYKSAWSQKRRGYVFVYVTKSDGHHPDTYHLCPGCLALALRRKTKHWPWFTKRTVIIPGCRAPQPLPPPPVNTVPRYYYNNTLGA